MLLTIKKSVMQLGQPAEKDGKLGDATRKSGRINPQLAPFPTKIATSGYPLLWCKCIPSYYILLYSTRLYAHCWLVLYLNLYISPSTTHFISLSHTNMGLSERRVPSKFMVYHPVPYYFPVKLLFDDTNRWSDNPK